MLLRKRPRRARSRCVRRTRRGGWLPMPGEPKHTDLPRLRVELVGSAPALSIRHRGLFEQNAMGQECRGRYRRRVQNCSSCCKIPPCPCLVEAIEFTAFALDEFQRRVAADDGASLWLLLVTSSVFHLGDAVGSLSGLLWRIWLRQGGFPSSACMITSFVWVAGSRSRMGSFAGPMAIGTPPAINGPRRPC